MRNRRSSRRGQPKQAGSQVEQRPKQHLQIPYEPTKVFSDDQIEYIHQCSLKLLRDTGINVLLPEAKQLLKDAGADVDPNSDRVRFDPDMVESYIGLAPSEVMVHARNPENNMHIGANRIYFDTVSSAPNVSDIDNGRRPGNVADFRNLLKLAQYFNVVSCIGGYPVEPLDWHASIRHLHATKDILTMTDKAIRGYSLGKDRLLDALEMSRIARGISEAQLLKESSLVTTINVNSPLVLDIAMSEGVIEMAKRNQLIILTPFTLAGAMAPVTLAGAIVQQNAECLGGYMLSQVVRKGAPIMYGAFTSNVDMKSGAPAFGTPEYMKSVIAGGQLARRYGLPYRTSNVCAANAVDAQAAYESVFSLWGVIMGGGNLVKHAAGWLEGGLCASYEKFVLDVDLLQMVSEFCQPIKLDDEEVALDTIDKVGPSGHFFGTDHTQERYKTAFYSPILSDWRNYETWAEAGSPHAWQKANTVMKQALEDYQQPDLDPAIAEELDAFVAKRIEQGGMKTDF